MSSYFFFQMEKVNFLGLMFNNIKGLKNSKSLIGHVFQLNYAVITCSRFFLFSVTKHIEEINLRVSK